MQPYIVSFIYNQRQALIERWEKELVTVRHENYLISISDSVYENTNREFMHFIIEMVDADQDQAKERLSVFADRYIQSGWPLAYFTKGLQAFRRVILVFLSEQEKDVDQLLSTFSDLESWIDGIINQSGS